MLFLYYTWAMNKNFETRQLVHSTSILDEDKGIVEDETKVNESYRTFTYHDLLSLISNYVETPEKIQARVKRIASEWKLSSNENLLKRLLEHHHDLIAADYGKFYRECATVKLLQFAIDNSNVVFIKHALRKKLIDPLVLNNQEMIKFLLDNFKKGVLPELILNILIFADFRRWLNLKDLKELIVIAQNIKDPDKEQNMMYVCYNPILVICLFS